MKIIKALSLSAYGLRYKLKIGFYLMSVLPLLICFYLISTYMLPTVGIKLNIAVLIAVSVVIALSGFFVVRQIIGPIINISAQAKNIASGNIDYQIRAERDDEIGDLENALNELTKRIRGNMHELEKYGEQTKNINAEINRKMVALSGLLQVSSFISQGESIDEILDLGIEKIAQIGETDTAFLLLQEGGDLLVKSAYGEDSSRLLGRRFNAKGDNLFAKIFRETKPFSLDKNTASNRLIEEFENDFGVKNAFITSIFVHNNAAGLIGVGNKRDFVYANEEINLINIFVKQMDIAIENNMLLHRVKNLEIKDTLTGLYNEAFIRARLDEEIKRAILYQRPCAFMLFSVNRYKELCSDLGISEAELILKKIAVILKDNIGEIDKAARFSEREFAFILPEKNKKQAQDIAQTIKARVEHLLKEEPDRERRVTLSTAVSENPIDGVTSLDLIARAQELLKSDI